MDRSQRRALRQRWFTRTLRWGRFLLWREADAVAYARRHYKNRKKCSCEMCQPYKKSHQELKELTRMRCEEGTL